MLVAQPYGAQSSKTGKLHNAGISHVQLKDGAVLTGAEFAEDAGGAEFHGSMKSDGKNGAILEMEADVMLA
jgi:hypothetical protein